MAQPDAYEGPTPLAVAGYRVDELVGAGATGEVWRARDVLSGRLVALKRLRHDGPPVERDRLRREAAVLAGLSSEHIVRLITVVTSATGLVLVLDYQGGGSLASLLRTRPVLAPGEVVTLAAPLAQALAEVHALGMVHGDLSPANVLFSTDGRPMLSDLGVARLVKGAFPGGTTTAFADPAVLDGSPFTPPCDVYALAAVCFTALTGAPPIRSDDGSLQLRLSATAPALPRAMVDVIEAALSGDVTARPDAAAFAARMLEAAPAAPVRLAGATVPVDSPPTAAVRRLPAPPTPEPPSPSRGERLAAAVGRFPVTPRRLVALAAVPVALGGAIWGGVAWARSTSAGAPAWTVTARAGAGATSSAVGPLGRPGAPDPGRDQAAGAVSGPATSASGPTRPGATAPVTTPPVRADATAEATPVARQAAQAATTPGPQTSGAGGEAPPSQATTGGESVATGAASLTKPSATALRTVLRRLDSTRDAAFGAGSATLLQQVYVTGSAPLAADTALLSAMTSAGRHAVGLRLDLRRVTVVAARGRSAEVLVTDTLPSYDLVSTNGERLHVSGRGEATWRIDLVETAAGWRIGAITTAAAA